MMQEKYLEADMAGKQKLEEPAFGGATATLQDVAITSDGQLRVARQADGKNHFVFKRLEGGKLAELLKDKRLPTDGGTFIGNPTWLGPGGKPMGQ